ncbi:hypothetical protein D3C84_795310 [compost metagenome]
MNIGVQAEEAMEHFAEQADVALAGKAIGVQGDFDIHAAQQEAFFETLDQVVTHLDDRRQPTSVQLAASPVVQRQGAAQHFGVVEHRQEVRAQVAEHAPVKTIAVRRVARQGRRAQVAHPQAGPGGLHQGIEQGALQGLARELAVGAGQAQ